MDPSEGPAATPTTPRGWLFLPPDAVPARWRSRGLEVVLVPLMPEEAAHLLNGGRANPDIEPFDEPLARLLAQGASTESIARRLGVSGRTAQRRISELRRRLGTRSRGELARVLAARGFAS